MELASRQSGYVTRRQAIACGMCADAVDRRVNSKRWSRIKPGLYLISGYSPSLRGLLVAATATLGAVVSHESAAELHDLPGTTRGLAVVTVRVRKTYRFPDVDRASIDRPDRRPGCRSRSDCRSPSPFELSSIWLLDSSPLQIGRIIDHIVLKRQGSLDEVCDLVLKLARHGKPGMKMHAQGPRSSRPEEVSWARANSR